MATTGEPDEFQSEEWIKIHQLLNASTIINGSSASPKDTLLSEETFKACLVLSGAGNVIAVCCELLDHGKALPAISGSSVKKSREMWKKLEKVNVKNCRLTEGQLMNLATCEALIAAKAPHQHEMTPELWVNEVLLPSLSLRYVSWIELMNDEKRLIAPATADALPAVRSHEWLDAPCNLKNNGGAPCPRALVLGLRFSGESRLHVLVVVALESARITNNSPLSMMGALAVASFASLAFQKEPIENWPHYFLQHVIPVAQEYLQNNYATYWAQYEKGIDAFTKTWQAFLNVRKMLSPGAEPYYPPNWTTSSSLRYKFYSKFALPMRKVGASGHDCVLLSYDSLLASKGDWAKAMQFASGHSGHKLYTATIVGGLFGIMYRFEGVPLGNYRALELRDKAEDLASQLSSLYKVVETHDDEILAQWEVHTEQANPEDVSEDDDDECHDGNEGKYDHKEIAEAREGTVGQADHQQVEERKSGKRRSAVKEAGEEKKQRSDIKEERKEKKSQGRSSFASEKTRPRRGKHGRKRKQTSKHEEDTKEKDEDEGFVLSAQALRALQRVESEGDIILDSSSPTADIPKSEKEKGNSDAKDENTRRNSEKQEEEEEEEEEQGKKRHHRDSAVSSPRKHKGKKDKNKKNKKHQRQEQRKAEGATVSSSSASNVKVALPLDLPASSGVQSAGGRIDAAAKGGKHRSALTAPKGRSGILPAIDGETEGRITSARNNRKTSTSEAGDDAAEVEKKKMGSHTARDPRRLSQDDEELHRSRKGKHDSHHKRRERKRSADETGVRAKSPREAHRKSSKDHSYAKHDKQQDEGQKKAKRKDSHQSKKEGEQRKQQQKQQHDSDEEDEQESEEESYSDNNDSSDEDDSPLSMVSNDILDLLPPKDALKPHTSLTDSAQHLQYARSFISVVRGTKRRQAEAHKTYYRQKKPVHLFASVVDAPLVPGDQAAITVKVVNESKKTFKYLKVQLLSSYVKKCGETKTLRWPTVIEKNDSIFVLRKGQSVEFAVVYALPKVLGWKTSTMLEDMEHHLTIKLVPTSAHSGYVVATLPLNVVTKTKK